MCKGGKAVFRGLVCATVLFAGAPGPARAQVTVREAEEAAQQFCRPVLQLVRSNPQIAAAGAAVLASPYKVLLLFGAAVGGLATAGVTLWVSPLAPDDMLCTVHGPASYRAGLPPVRICNHMTQMCSSPGPRFGTDGELGWTGSERALLNAGVARTGSRTPDPQPFFLLDQDGDRYVVAESEKSPADPNNGAAERAKRRHDLNNVLTIVVGYSALMASRHAELRSLSREINALTDALLKDAFAGVVSARAWNRLADYVPTLEALRQKLEEMRTPGNAAAVDDLLPGIRKTADFLTVATGGGAVLANGTLADEVRSLTRMFAGPRVVFNLRLSPEEPVALNLLALDGVLHNLVQNAVTAARNRKMPVVTITIQTRILRGDRRRIYVIDVWDNAGGAPLTKLSEAAAGNNGKSPLDLHGWGLENVFEGVTRDLHGTLQVDVVRGRGTHFRILFPVNGNGAH